ncbi:MAG: hypothetical protein ACYSW3_02260 [Planctomycetota bacterium]|jgi:hypothetical protein
MPNINDVRNMVNQARFNQTKAEDDLGIKWGPTVFKKDFTNISLTTVVYDAMQHLMSEGATVVHDCHVIHGVKRYTIEVWYGCHEIIEDPRDGQPISPDNL